MPTADGDAVRACFARRYRRCCATRRAAVPHPRPTSTLPPFSPPFSNTHQLTVRRLLPWARDHLLRDRPELFMKGDSV